MKLDLRINRSFITESGTLLLGCLHGKQTATVSFYKLGIQPIPEKHVNLSVHWSTHISYISNCPEFVVVVQVCDYMSSNKYAIVVQYYTAKLGCYIITVQ